MDQSIFERPREKLQYSGVSALTNTELLQVIVGSGSVRIPVAKIARNVSQALEKTATPITRAVLAAIPGVGAATASRIIAAIELGRRLHANTAQSSSIDITRLQQSRKKSIVYATISGSGAILQTIFVHIKPSESSTVLARRICAQVLSDNAWGVRVVIGYAKAQDQPGMFELGLVSDVQSIARRLHIKVLSVEYVTSATRIYMHRSAS